MKMRITGPDGYPVASLLLTHRQRFGWDEGQRLLVTLKRAVMAEHGVGEGEPTPFWQEAPAPTTDQPVVDGKAISLIPEPTARDRACALVDALAELESRLRDEGGELELVMVVRR